jgi:hypothetical protein
MALTIVLVVLAMSEPEGARDVDKTEGKAEKKSLLWVPVNNKTKHNTLRRGVRYRPSKTNNSVLCRESTRAQRDVYIYLAIMTILWWLAEKGKGPGHRRRLPAHNTLGSFTMRRATG